MRWFNVLSKYEKMQLEINKLIENYQKKKFKLVIKQALLILKRDPKQLLSRKILGSAYEQTGFIYKALKTNKEVVRLSPEDPEGFNNLGIIFHKLKNYYEAEYNFKQALKIKEDFDGALYNLGNVLKETGKLKEAEEIFIKCIKLNPNFSNAYVNLSNTQREIGKFSQAENTLLKCIEHNPDFIEAHYNLGNLFKELNKLDESENSYNKALNLNPSFKLALLGRGQILFTKKKFDQALIDFDRCNTSQSRERSLVTLYKLGRIDEIFQRIKKNSKLDEKNLRVAAFSSFISHKEKKETKNNFCKDPLEFLYFSNLSSHLKNSNKFIGDLIDELKHIDANWEPYNKTTVKGFQSTKNLFKDPAGKIKDVQKIIINELQKYNLKFKNKSCLFIKQWPHKKNLFGWYVILKKQGFQDPHIHPSGWLSGVIYLKTVPSLKKNEGAIEFSLNAKNYSDSKSPKIIYQPMKGDIVFFPSTLHHRTIPFTTDTDRIIVSFDLLPIIE